MEEAGMAFFLKSWEGAWLCRFLTLWISDSGLHSCEKINFCCCKPPSVVICYCNPRKITQIYSKKISAPKYISTIAKNYIISKFIPVVYIAASFKIKYVRSLGKVTYLRELISHIRIGSKRPAWIAKQLVWHLAQWFLIISVVSIEISQDLEKSQVVLPSKNIPLWTNFSMPLATR